MPIKGGYICGDCKRNHFAYMANNAVWQEAVVKKPVEKTGAGSHPNHKIHICLCLHCLEGRLGRPLRLSDFRTEVPCNDALIRLFGYTSQPPIELMEKMVAGDWLLWLAHLRKIKQRLMKSGLAIPLNESTNVKRSQL